MKKLFKTIVGSHAWDMQRSDSDTDTFEGYIVPTKDILSGILRQNSHFTSGEDKDESRHEIGVIIEQLIKSNFNFVVGVYSPIIEEDEYGYLAELRDIVKRNLAKNIYHSTMGLATHNWRKYFVNNIKDGTITEEDLQKKRNQIVRSLIFGCDILYLGYPTFRKIRDQRDIDVQFWMKEIKIFYEESKLPKSPDPTEFRNFLYKLRINELENKI
jgi:hypothetical protein